MFKKKKSEKAYTSAYYSSSKSEQANAIQDRRKSIGKNLSFSASEAYKLLRTNLIFSMSDEAACKIIGVTSSQRGEGKSTTSMNLAYALAETGKKVLLMEADMRIPVIAKTLRINETPGLSNVLAGLNQLNETVQGPVLLKSLYVITSGEMPPNPSELLTSSRMEQMLTVLSESFDYIITDLPPVNAVSDGLAVSKYLTGMVVVVRQNYCDQHSLAEAMRQLEFLKVKVLGFVMNDAESDDKRQKKYSRNYSKGSHGYYGYGEKKKASKPENNEESTPPED